MHHAPQYRVNAPCAHDSKLSMRFQDPATIRLQHCSARACHLNHARLLAHTKLNLLGLQLQLYHNCMERGARQGHHHPACDMLHGSPNGSLCILACACCRLPCWRPERTFLCASNPTATTLEGTLCCTWEGPLGALCYTRELFFLSYHSFIIQAALSVSGVPASVTMACQV